MTNKTIKGFCAWHPERGIMLDSVASYKEMAEKALCLFAGYYEDPEFMSGSTCPSDAYNDGWRIVPVTLTVDEEI